MSEMRRVDLVQCQRLGLAQVCPFEFQLLLQISCATCYYSPTPRVPVRSASTVFFYSCPFYRWRLVRPVYDTVFNLFMIQGVVFLTESSRTI